MDINRFFWNSLSESEKEKIFSRSQTDISEVLPEVQKIINEVRRSGDAALRRFSEQWDHVDLSARPLRVQPEEFEDASSLLPEDLKTALDFSIESSSAVFWVAVLGRERLRCQQMLYPGSGLGRSSCLLIQPIEFGPGLSAQAGQTEKCGQYCYRTT